MWHLRSAPGPGPSCRALSCKPPAKPALTQFIDRDVIQTCHHKVRTGRPQRGCIAMTADAERPQLTRAGCLDADGRILGNETMGWIDVQLRGSQQEYGRIRLAPRQVAPADIGTENVEETLAGVEADRLHHAVGIFRGRRDSHGPAESCNRLNKPNCVWESFHAALVNQFFKPFLLALGIGDRLSLGILHAKCLQRSAGTTEARLVRNLC